MMLHDMQAAMLRGILAGDSVAGLVISDDVSADDRLCIYRNTFVSSLANALRISFPAVHRLVGADFFDALAQAFVTAQPPHSAYLNEYGAAFADFIAGFAPAESLPYLADMARLEWAVNGALHAPDETPLDPAALGAPESDAHFTMQGSLSLIRADYPVDAIWSAVLTGDDPALAAIDLAEGAVRLLVSRDHGDVTVTRLSEQGFAFTAALAAGVPLERALEQCGEEEGVLLLARHLAAGRFTAIHTQGMQT